MIWDCVIVGLLWLDHIQSLADVTMTTIAIGTVSKLILPRTSCYLFSIPYVNDVVIFTWALLTHCRIPNLEGQRL
jgi:hypothetical protein